MLDYEEQRLRVEVPEQATVEVTFAVVDFPPFLEGFDFAVRFRDGAGNVTAERRYDEFDPPAAEMGTASSATFTLPSGRATIESHLTTSNGAGTRRPDFTNDGFGPPCPPKPIDLRAGDQLTFTVEWATGCLVERPLPVDGPRDAVRNWLFAIQEGDLDLAVSYVADDLDGATREMLEARDRLNAEIVAVAPSEVQVRLRVTDGPPLRTVPACPFALMLSDDLQITEAMSCPLPPPG